jgi:hypothetical protein
MATRMQQRRGTAAQWTAANPVLAAGEIGFETDTNKFKVGNGSTAWASLTYFVDASIVFDSAEVTAAINSAIDAVIDAAPNTLNTLNELAAAIGDDASFAVNTANNINTLFSTTSSHANSISSQGNTISTLQNDLSLLDSEVSNGLGNAYGNLVAHEADTSNVHGIGNMLALAFSADVTSEISNAIATHESDTSNVHGIANTAALVLTSDARLSDERVPTDGSVVEGKIASGAVTNGKIGADAVDGTKIADDSISAEHIADEVITNAHISNTAAIAQSKISNLTTDLGNKQDKVSGVSDTEIGYLDGVTSNVQAQIDAKAALAGASFTGNVSTTGDLTVDGNFVVNGSNVLVSATQIQIEDTLLQLGHTNSANTTDLGLFASYNDGSQKHTGLVKDVTDGKWKLFDGVTSEPTTTVNFAQGSFDNLKVAALEATTVTPSSGVVFSDGTQTKEAVPSRTAITSVTGAYNLSTGGLALRDGLLEANSSSAFTITIPDNSTTAYPVGTSIDILQVGSGQITVAGAGGVTVNGTPGLKLRTQWSSATLFKRATDSWVVLGDLSA